MNRQPEPKHWLQLHIIVLIWGLTSVLGFSISVSALALVWWRVTLALPLLLGLYLWRYKNEIPSLPEIIGLMGNGFLIGIHWILFFGSARISNVSTSLAGNATTAFWTSLMEPFILKRRYQWMESLLGVLVVAGLYFIIQANFDNLAGLLMAIACAVAGALFSVFNGLFIQRHSAVVITVWQLLGAWLLLGCLLLLGNVFGIALLIPTAPWMLQSNDWVFILLLSWLCTVYPYVATVDLMKHFTAYAMNLTINLEPIYGMILAYLFFGEKEKMSPEFYIGTLLIIVSVMVYPLIARKQQNAASVSH